MADSTKDKKVPFVPKNLFYTDLSDDGDKRQRRVVYRLARYNKQAIDIVLQWKRFLSQEKYHEDPVTTIGLNVLHTLVEEALLMNDPTLVGAEVDIADQLETKVLTAVEEAGFAGVTIEAIRFRGRARHHFEVDLKIFLKNNDQYSEIDRVSAELNSLLQPESGVVHDVGYGNMGLTFWQSFELPFLKWVV